MKAVSSRRIFRCVASSLTLAAVLTGCGNDKFTGYELPGMRNAPAPASPTAPPINMGGRWTLISPGRGQCGMTFGFTPNATEGTIAPEGGCPAKFFTSRKWTYEATGLAIRDHNAEPLAQLTFAAGHFEGQAVDGAAITLTRGGSEPLATIR